MGATLDDSARRKWAGLAEDVAARLVDLANKIKTLGDPSETIQAVLRARAGLRRMDPETQARMMVLEAINHGVELHWKATRSRPARDASSLESLGALAAHFYEPVSLPGYAIPDDPSVWAELAAVWLKGPGAPVKGEKGDKWKTLARLLTDHLGGAHVAGSTLKSQWQRWRKTEFHLSPRRPGR